MKFTPEEYQARHDARKAAEAETTNGTTPPPPRASTRTTNGNKPPTEELPPDFSQALLSARNLQALEIEQRPRLLGEWMREGDLGYLFAPRGGGKPWLAMLIGNAVAEGVTVARRDRKAPLGIEHKLGDAAEEVLPPIFLVHVLMMRDLYMICTTSMSVMHHFERV